MARKLSIRNKVLATSDVYFPLNSQLFNIRLSEMFNILITVTVSGILIILSITHAQRVKLVLQFNM